MKSRPSYSLLELLQITSRFLSCHPSSLLFSHFVIPSSPLSSSHPSSLSPSSSQPPSCASAHYQYHVWFDLMPNAAPKCPDPPHIPYHACVCVCMSCLCCACVTPLATPPSGLSPSTLPNTTQSPGGGSTSTLSKKRPPPPPPGHKRTLSDPHTPLSHTPLIKGGHPQGEPVGLSPREPGDASSLSDKC